MKTFQKLAPHLRWMTSADMPEVLAIEEACFQWDAWTKDDFLHNLRIRNVIGMVADEGDIVIGQFIYAMHKSHIEMLNFAVHPDYQRRGVGAACIDRLTAKLSMQRRYAIVFDVSEHNLAGQLFLRAMEFRAEQVVPGRFSNRPEVDAYRFVYRIKEGACV